MRLIEISLLKNIPLLPLMCVCERERERESGVNGRCNVMEWVLKLKMTRRKRFKG
jgi:hypothetical protein